MRKLFFSLLIFTGLLFLTGCGMKECKCYVSDKCYFPNGSIEGRSDTVYIVYNYTRSNCMQFTDFDTIKLDSTSYILHTVLCGDN